MFNQKDGHINSKVKESLHLILTDRISSYSWANSKNMKQSTILLS